MKFLSIKKVSNGQERVDVLDIFIQRYNDAVLKKHQFFIVPVSTFIIGICQVLYKEGILLHYLVLENGTIKIFLGFNMFGLPFCKKLERISKVSKRVFFNKKNEPYLLFLKKRLQTIISTPKGIMTYKEALLFGEGGEVLFFCLI